MKQLTDEQKDKIAKALGDSLKESYGDVVEHIRKNLGKVFIALKKGEEYNGDIVLMFCQEEVQKLVDNGYEWGS